MRFLLHPTSRSAAAAARAKAQFGRPTALKAKIESPSSMSQPQVTSILENSNGSTNRFPASQAKPQSPRPQRITKLWGQQCGPCACVLRLEAEVDENTQRIRSASYVAKEVMTTRDGASGKLQPVYTTRTHRPMLQECQCQSLHSLAQTLTSYLPNKRIENVRPDFQSTRSSTAFRHAVLSSHGLPTTNTHCFDVVEDAFTAMIDGVIPSKRQINVTYTKLLRAEMMQRPLISMISTSPSQQASGQSSSSSSIFPQYQRGRIIRGNGAPKSGRLGSDSHGVSMASPRTVSTLHMFDLNSEYWEDEENYSGAASRDGSVNKTTSRRRSLPDLDWLSFVDQQYENSAEESA